MYVFILTFQSEWNKNLHTNNDWVFGSHHYSIYCETNFASLSILFVYVNFDVSFSEKTHLHWLGHEIWVLCYVFG